MASVLSRRKVVLACLLLATRVQLSFLASVAIVVLVRRTLCILAVERPRRIVVRLLGRRVKVVAGSVASVKVRVYNVYLKWWSTLRLTFTLLGYTRCLTWYVVSP